MKWVVFKVYWGKQGPQGKVVADGGVEGWQGGERESLWRRVRFFQETGWAEDGDRLGGGWMWG